MFDESKVGGIRIDNGTAKMNNISFKETGMKEGEYYDGSSLLI
jgi:hypothetical protein